MSFVSAKNSVILFFVVLQFCIYATANQCSILYAECTNTTPDYCCVVQVGCPGLEDDGTCYHLNGRYMKVKSKVAASFCMNQHVVEADPKLYNQCGIDPADMVPCAEIWMWPAPATDCDDSGFELPAYRTIANCCGWQCVFTV
ncbi:hypothetical protein F1728_25610 [Gimesia benthica]|uniref:Uncharacterized protein n=1 Tax=Gimesia benthica TaxID=2608982 RepID=A0A6I6AJT4_9PLAN|nr:hypothetical protein [Gimesia benthica]QGQ25842.1 hypothetical protein F1728_25610 [Gimesia benthica]